MLVGYRIDISKQQMPNVWCCRKSRWRFPRSFGNPSYPTIPLEPFQREQTLRNIEKSGWRDSNPRTLEIGEKFQRPFFSSRTPAITSEQGVLPVMAGRQNKNLFFLPLRSSFGLTCGLSCR